jgi:hypothetical protein
VAPVEAATVSKRLFTKKQELNTGLLLLELQTLVAAAAAGEAGDREEPNKAALVLFILVMQVHRYLQAVLLALLVATLFIHLMALTFLRLMVLSHQLLNILLSLVVAAVHKVANKAAVAAARAAIALQLVIQSPKVQPIPSQLVLAVHRLVVQQRMEQLLFLLR